ncbi:MAG: hypothetical protein L6R36_004964 [Xanthoria steineri]|nr:MAG: hypothetical protein L6R36_004964 [Xanthoria steineri]
MSNCTSNLLSLPFPSSSLVYLLRERMEPPANSNQDEKRTQVGETEILSVEERDVLALARLGKKPVSKDGNKGADVRRPVPLGRHARTAVFAYLGGNMIIALAQLNHPSYTPELWQGTLVFWCVIAVSILVNTYASKVLPKLEFHSVVAYCGLLCDLDRVSFVLNGVFGFAMLLAILFVTTDISSALASPTGTLGFPFIQIFYTTTNTPPGASAMISVLIIMDICAAIAFLATSSRIVFAFGRDKGLPFGRTMATVQDESAIPLYAIMLMALVSCVVDLINIGSAIAFNAIISVGVSSLYASYVLTEALLLWHRCTPGPIQQARRINKESWHANELAWGPFHVPGVWGILLNAFAVGYGIIVSAFSFFRRRCARMRRDELELSDFGDYHGRGSGVLLYGCVEGISRAGGGDIALLGSG